MIRYRNCAILALPLTLTAARPTQPTVNPPGVVTFEVTSTARKYTPGSNRGEPIEFEVHVLGADLKRAVDFDRKTTPYNVIVPGREAYAMFRQVGGSDFLHVVVRPTDHNSCQVNARLSFIVVRGDRCGGNIMRP